MLTRAAYLLPHKRLVNGEQRIGNNLMNLLPKCIDIHAALFQVFHERPDGPFVSYIGAFFISVVDKVGIVLVE